MWLGFRSVGLESLGTWNPGPWGSVGVCHSSSLLSPSLGSGTLFQEGAVRTMPGPTCLLSPGFTLAHVCQPKHHATRVLSPIYTPRCTHGRHAPPNTLFPSQTSVPEANASGHRLADQRGSLAMHCMVGTSRGQCAMCQGCGV